MWNKIFLLFIIGYLGMSSSLAQQHTGKKDEVRVPREYLEPALALSTIENRLKEIKNVLSNHIPETITPEDKLKENEKNITKLQFMSSCIFFRNLVTNPDLEEVSGIQQKWFIEIYNNMLSMIPILENMDNSRIIKNERKYTECKKYYEVKAQEILKLFKKPPRISKDAMKDIRDRNIERRKAEYIEKMKKERENAKTGSKKPKDNKDR